MPCRINTPIHIFLGKLKNRAIELGIITHKSSEEDVEEFNEFVCWMAMDKKTSKTKKIFNYGIQSIKVCSELFNKYSHARVNIVLNDKHFWRLFSYFNENGRNEFLEQFEGEERKIYEKGLNQLCENLAYKYS